MTVINLFDKESSKGEDQTTPDIKTLMKDYIEDDTHYEGGLVVLESASGDLHLTIAGLTTERAYFVLSAIRASLLRDE